MDSGYRSGDIAQWTGRVDGTDERMRRWHQVIRCVDLHEVHDLKGTVVLLGFCCDEGVRRNQGRIGAKAGPEQFRKVLSGLPVHFSEMVALVDAGDVHCLGADLESAQSKLAELVTLIRKQGGFPLLLGGGHEITYAHFKGLDTDDRSIGIVNIDAHLDIRPLKDGAGNSGTGFYQIAEDLTNSGRTFNYLALGIQDISNTQALLSYAKEKGTKIIKAEDICAANVDAVIAAVHDFAAQVDQIYLTIDLDAFAAPYAPGVSALAFNGIIPDVTFRRVFQSIINLPNLVSLDVAELNPLYDIDQRTTKLGADLIFKFLQQF
ncbi:formiminoglutamase [Sphingobacterium nematocida]|uniref:Formimidoylglutamase n=1 Tax=Sphingobacterium nematocida TaxID=1513896 RepID=A0A1T5F9M9_9SPHI|nr:formimidoylglutamase [Sphingobacterium nematocida]SKB92889.1 formiminoglutamase [Sphingobacterium nematocida]